MKKGCLYPPFFILIFSVFFLYKSGKAQPVEITTGIRTEAEVQVLQGLNIGDTIITSGTLQLRTGLPVTLDNIN